MQSLITYYGNHINNEIGDEKVYVKIFVHKLSSIFSTSLKPGEKQQKKNPFISAPD